ncbi:glutathione S-transferase family protein [Glaciecola petra]|uniref:Glutathione S-transferase family protein n=1 Tax=Glaciecola petra TaxID=3075602 RepID=A0ABU2ZR16_9ALTE|nr:glutathione S-transferase family protein [Aestuariibacter sp. P117]MDT0595081.1 glutathione S-transferase family protein [Aestuariibacter sp. P117]
MVKIYGDKKSGNCYKVQLTCELLRISYEWIDVDILAKETQSEAFLALNPNGKIPLLVTADEKVLSESNAIINFLATDSHLLPNDPYLLSLVQQWQFFEQYSHEPYIAVARFINKYLGLPENRKAEYVEKQIGGNKALRIMNEQLKKTEYLVSSSLTTADITLFAYTHVAHEGGFTLENYEYVSAWCERIKQHPLYIKM